MAAELGLTVRHVWIEVGSASRFSTRKRRDEQDKALQALVNGETGALWVYKLDRWDRRGAGAILEIIEPKDGIPRRLLFDNGDPEKPGIELDSTNPRDRGELIRRAESAREETDRLSDRVRDTKGHQRATGQWIQGRAPYGAKVVIVEDPEDPEEDLRILAPDDAPAITGKPDPTKAGVAARIFEDVAEGWSLRKLAAQLDDEKIPGPRGEGTHWVHATLRKMVHNPIYAGWQPITLTPGGKSVQFRGEDGKPIRVWEGLVSDELQARAVAKLVSVEPDEKTQRLLTAGASGGKARHLLTGLLVCEADGSRMPHRGNGYACWRWENCPKPTFVGTKPIETYVLDRWLTRLSQADPDDPLLEKVAARWAALKRPDETRELLEAKAALHSAQEAMKRLERDRRAGLYDGPAESLYAPAMRETMELVSRASALVADVSNVGAPDVSFLFDEELCMSAWAVADTSTRRDLLRLAVDRIVVAKAPYHAAPFRGLERVLIHWVDGTAD
ncbi:recombinase family protein [Streptomyces sp. NRRL F-5630]|uniref:recombinase family protein n=1 Tax=Streptomyces sp. NRRL F-5630 TaxID=1463864 RepID=UPI0004CC3810